MRVDLHLVSYFIRINLRILQNQPKMAKLNAGRFDLLRLFPKRHHFPLIKLMSIIYIIHFIIIGHLTTMVKGQNSRIRICVPDPVYEDCLQMSDNIRGLFSCINARDKFECMQLIDKDEADIVNVDAEDLYLGGRLFDLEPFIMEEHNGNMYLQRSAVVVPRSSRIQTIGDLKGKRACLGPYNDLYQWNIPIGILLASETIVPDCRNELYTVENFFLEACAAGNWTNDLFLDEELKRNHQRLCTLCKDTAFGLCTEQDMYAGQEGSLKCLLEGRGEVAFTTLETAVEVFGRRPSEREHFELLCLDGSRMAIGPRGCDWAKHPTNTFVIRKGRERNKESYLRMLQQVFLRFVKLRPSWFDKAFVSSINVTQLVSIPFTHAKYTKYLEFYAPSIEKPLHGCPKRNITFCLSKEGELTKCQQLQKAAFSRRIRPPIRCYQADSEQTCVRLLNERKADLIVLPPDRFYYAARYQSLQALALEVTDQPRYSVAVVRANSDLTMLGHLKGKRSCHSGFGHLAGWTVPIGYLIRDQVVDPTSCNRAQVVIDYFSGSCVPGAADARINPNGTGVRQLCSQCIGDDRGNHHCDLDFGERYSGEEGALRCLVEGRGDVAFVSHDTVLRLTNGRFPVGWAVDLKPSDFRLLCRIPADIFDARTGGFLRGNSIDDVVDNRNTLVNSRTLLQATIHDYNRCHIARIPDSIIATSVFTPLETRLEAMLLLNQLSETFLDRHRMSFRLSGLFRNRSNIIFSDNTKKIKTLRPDVTLEETLMDFLPFLEDNDPIACKGFHSYQHGHHKFWLILPIFISLMYTTSYYYLYYMH